ncbi:MAG: hypothetical protein U0136_12025 [Bdellovibrionota bacterium]
MDLYRYFHPHHNPRLKNIPLRLQELAELEQAATELKRALERAKLRATDHPVGGIRKEHFGEILIAMDYVVDSLSTLTKAHPGDESETMAQLLKERVDAPGWENWARLLEQRILIAGQYESVPESLSRSSSSK